MESGTGLKLLLRNKQFWLLATAYSVMTGVYAGWGPLYTLIIKMILSDDGEKGDAQSIAAKVGLTATFAGNLSTIAFSGISDAFSKWITMRTILLLICVTAMLLYSTLCVLLYNEDWIKQ